MQKLPILQSGFIAINEDLLYRTDPVKDAYTSYVLDKDYLLNINNYFYSREATNLYEAYRADTSKVRSFAFREEVIKCAIKLFGLSLWIWFSVQNEKRTVSSLHSKCLEETLAFIVENKPRTIQPAQWISLLEASSVTMPAKVDSDKYFVCDNNSVTFTISPIANFLVSWLSMPDGFEDLIVMLHVIFGQRKYITDVDNKPDD